jgi:hypothetical protein
MYKVVKGQESGVVYLNRKPEGIPKQIYLALATQQELEYLFSISHPFVYKDVEPDKMPDNPEDPGPDKKKPVIKKL